MALKPPLTDDLALLLNEREAAKYLGICPRTLATLRKAGRIPAVIISARCVRYSRQKLAEWVLAQSKGGAA